MLPYLLKFLLTCSLFLLCYSGVQAQVNLFGMTRGGNPKIVRYEVGADNLSGLYEFNDGAAPWYNDFIEVEGKLYGLTASGGSKDHGTLFSFDIKSRQYTLLHEFDGSNGSSPHGSLVYTDGVLYGLCESGGNSNNGMIFSFNLTTKVFKKCFEFDGANGKAPFGTLLQKEDLLYGLTASGGASGSGVLFSYNDKNSSYEKLHDFTEAAGKAPYGSLIENNGRLYGLTQFGGSNGYGTLFSFDISGRQYINLVNFDWANGAWPNSTLTEHNGSLYGMTESGGSYNSGVIFKYKVAEKKLEKVKDFLQTDGRSPFGTLLKASNNKMYGLTYRGGGNDLGVLFSLDPADNAFTLLKSLDASMANPAASLLELAIEPEEAPLPLKVTAFLLRPVGDKVEVQLHVADETNIEQYELQRSNDGIVFSPIATAKANNNPYPGHYTFTDPKPFSLNFYRIKIYERDFPAHYTPVKSIAFDAAGLTIRLAANPVISNISLELNIGTTQKISFYLFDSHGRLIKNWGGMTFSKGPQRLELNAADLPTGYYYLQAITSLGERKTIPLVK